MEKTCYYYHECLLWGHQIQTPFHEVSYRLLFPPLMGHFTPKSWQFISSKDSNLNQKCLFSKLQARLQNMSFSQVNTFIRLHIICPMLDIF